MRRLTVLAFVEHDFEEEFMGVLMLNAQADGIELAELAIVVEEFLAIVGVVGDGHDHNAEADGAGVVLRAFVLEGRGLRVLIDGEAGPAVEGVDVFGQAVTAQGLDALGTVVHLVEDVGAGAGTHAMDIRGLGGRQTVHLFRLCN